MWLFATLVLSHFGHVKNGTAYLIYVYLLPSLNSHIAAIAAGNNGIPVRMHGYEFGKASGMAPRAR
jgi:hypothetical protein